MSGIYNELHYNKGHYEVAPYNHGHKTSAYHVRNYDVYKMLQVKQPLDFFLSHDWPRGIEKFGNTKALLDLKTHLASDVMHRRHAPVDENDREKDV